MKLYTLICLPFGKYENKHPIIIITSHRVNRNQIVEQIKLKITQNPLYLWQDMFGQRRSGYYQSYVRLLKTWLKGSLDTLFIRYAHEQKGDVDYR